MKVVHFNLTLCLALTACGLSPDQLTKTAALAQAQTQTAAPTKTPIATPTATLRPTSTVTLTPTKTGTPPPLPTRTSTPHPLAALDMHILFAARQESKMGLYVIAIDGSEARRLTDSSAASSFPSLSSDGKQVVFVSNLDDQPSLAIMSIDGTDVQRISTRATEPLTPAWAPDGKRIVFVSGPEDGKHLFVVNADGSGEQQITQGTTTGYSPAWSPDGQWIAFSSSRTGNPNIFIVRPDGTGLKQITHSLRYSGDAPSWTPDSQWLVFPSNRIGNYELYLVKLDGSVFLTLTRTEDLEFYGVVSPDGRYLLMKVFNQDGASLVIRDLKTGATFNIVQAAEDISVPAWFPNTAMVSFDTAALLAAGVIDSTCTPAADETYGFNPDNPASIGNGPQFGGPFDGFHVFTFVRSRKGEPFAHEEVGDLVNAKGDIIAVHTLTTESGLAYTLYVNGSDYSIPRIPIGLACDLQLP